MTTPTITILGLGPGSINDLTLEGYRLLEEAAQKQATVYFRTRIHPTVEALQERLPQLQIESFDSLYDESDDWHTLYEQIAAQVCAVAERGPIIYAVPGHPLIGESSVQIILKQTRERNLSTKIVGGLSFLAPVYAAVELDPFEHGAQLIDATELVVLKPEEIAGRVIPTVPLFVAHVYNRRVASAVKLALSECYPDNWPVKLVRTGDIDSAEQTLELPLFELDRTSFINRLYTLYVPPVGEMSALRLPETLRYIIMRLRREPDGCPWDREQTHQTLKKYVIEEAYEVLETLEENDVEKLAEELGDLLLQVYLHAEVGRQADEFAIGDVFEHINAKMIRRHPHVFGDVEVSETGQVLQNWEAIKKQERAAAGTDVQAEGVLDRVPLVSPALTVAQEYQKRVSKIGFEFESISEVYVKLEEELQEFKQARNLDEQREEIGDLLFMVAKLARFCKIDAEEALRNANRKFKQRFQVVEQLAREDKRAYVSYNAHEWISLWNKAKAIIGE
ncbi:MAG TPA: nucleoside triphosphate pyrophosphohydrolase [Ktedonobacteraceae bacterium]|nr:nucleoside triphosphate pyrophosphohydrolase [Ktedonobacteraceae bacterium]